MDYHGTHAYKYSDLTNSIQLANGYDTQGFALMGFA